jgi:hypothetical protein
MKTAKNTFDIIPKEEKNKKTRKSIECFPKFRTEKDTRKL